MSAKPLLIVGAVVELLIFILYGVFVRFDEYARMEDQSAANLQESLNIFVLRYPMLQDVHVMMFIGFGFLMTFLKHHGWSGVSINFIAAALTIQWYILFEGFWHCVSTGDWSDTLNISTELFTRADYAAAAILISFGGLIGKINTAQMMLMVTIETFIYAIEEMLIYDKIQAFDAGGSMVIHTYGAYFGLMVSLIFSPKTVIGNPYNDSNYSSNLFAMIGTIFLWMHWPSFNAGILNDPAGIHRAVVNTILSLTGSCISVFMASAVYNEGRFHMEDILNATLAGGVVIGASCDVIIYPFTSLICGFIAGVISTIGFKRITRFLEINLGLFDTAGINNLHGMPGFLGGILSAIVIGGLESNQWHIKPEAYGMDGFYKQGGLQIAATFTALGFGLVGGAITGFILKFVPLEQTNSLFEDKAYWIKCNPEPWDNPGVSGFPLKETPKGIKYEAPSEEDFDNSPKKKNKKGKVKESDSDY